MTPAEGTVLALLVPTAGSIAYFTAQVEQGGGGMWAVLLSLIGVISGVGTWLIKRDDARQKREDDRMKAREEQMTAQTGELKVQSELLREIVLQQRELREHQQKSDEHRYRATRAISDQLDGIPERVENRLRDKLK